MMQQIGDMHSRAKERGKHVGDETDRNVLAAPLCVHGQKGEMRERMDLGRWAEGAAGK